MTKIFEFIFDSNLSRKDMYEKYSAFYCQVPAKTSPQTCIEWHQGDVSRGGYVTEIAGGVVCKMNIQVINVL